MSISYLLPVLHLLNTQTLAADEEDTELTRSIKTKVLGYMEAKYEDPATQTLLNIDTFFRSKVKKKTTFLSEMKAIQKEAQPAVDISSSAGAESKCHSHKYKEDEEVFRKPLTDLSHIFICL
ncbi:unnamed protein product [Leuciscus chuanchicus]